MSTYLVRTDSWCNLYTNIFVFKECTLASWQCDQIWLVPAKLAGFRVCVAGKNLRLAGGWFGWLLHKMNCPGLGIFLAI